MKSAGDLLIMPCLAPQLQQQQQAATQAPEQYRARLGNLMERLGNLGNGHQRSGWSNRGQGDIFGDIENRFRRDNVENIIYFRRRIADIQSR